MFRELLRGESQNNPHAWSATLLGHCWIGVGLWGAIAIILDRWTAVYLAPLAYLLLWEGLQLMLADRVTARLLWDGILDSVSVTLGCIAAAYLGDGYILTSMWAWSGSVVVTAVGWQVRDQWR